MCYTLPCWLSLTMATTKEDRLDWCCLGNSEEADRGQRKEEVSFLRMNRQNLQAHEKGALQEEFFTLSMHLLWSAATSP